MLNVSHMSVREDKQEKMFDLSFVMRVFRRHWKLITWITVGGLLAGIVFVVLYPPTYRSVARLLISPPLVNVFQRNSVMPESPVNVLSADTQVEIIKSETVVRRVVENLKLQKDPEFATPSLIRKVTDWVNTRLGNPPRAPTEEALIRLAIANLQLAITVTRVTPTLVLELSVDTRVAPKSARIAAELAESYLTDLLDARSKSANRASAWLQGRLGELRDQAVTADRAVQDFKVQNDVVDASGRLVSDLQLTELNTQLLAAQSQSSESRARLDRINDLLQSGAVDVAVPDSMRNEVLTKLRQSYLENLQRESEFSGRYGVNHNATVVIRNQMKETQKAILDEMRRMQDSYKSDYEIAKSREASLRVSMQAAIENVARTRQAQVKLRELESTSQSSRAIYDSFLQRSMQTLQQETGIASDARVITAPVPIATPYFPNPKLIVPASLIMGLMLGLGFAGLRELLDQLVRTPRQLEQAIGSRCLGMLPDLSHQLGWFTRRRARASRAIMLAASVDHPASPFAETIRSVRVAIDVNEFVKNAGVIGIVSAVKGEGKSTVSSNLARLMATSGKSVLLIDCDMKSSTLTNAFVPAGTPGLMEVLMGRETLTTALRHDEASGLHFLSAGALGREGAQKSSELLASPAMLDLLETARGIYRYVILDLPPLTPLVDVRASAHMADAFVLVTKWSDTSEHVLRDALRTSAHVQGKLIGAVLNRVDLRKIGRFRAPEDVIYGAGAYEAYGYVSEPTLKKKSAPAFFTE